MSINPAKKTGVPAGAPPAPRGVPGEPASRAGSARRVRLRSGASGSSVATVAIAAAVIGALVAAGTIAMTPRGPALSLAGRGRVAPAGAAVTPLAAPTSLAFGVEDIAFQNEIEMSLLATR